MNELALYILDLAQNSITAGAKLVTITVRLDRERDEGEISIADDGKGMDAELLKRVESPFATTRTTRKVGLGIPMFKQCVQDCGGRFSLESAPGVGTRIAGTFRLSHVDLPPMGDLAESVRSLLIGAPDKPEFRLEYWAGGETFAFDTREIREALDGVPFTEPAVAAWLGDYLKEGIEAAASR